MMAGKGGPAVAPSRLNLPLLYSSTLNVVQ